MRALEPLPPSREMSLLIRKQDRAVATIRAVTQALVDVFERSVALFDA